MSMRAVLDAFTAGARSRAELARATGLRPDAVDLAIEQLIRLGRLEAQALGSGCPDDGCGGCGTSATCGAPRRGGPVLVRLRPPSAGS